MKMNQVERNYDFFLRKKVNFTFPRILVLIGNCVCNTYSNLVLPISLNEESSLQKSIYFIKILVWEITDQVELLKYSC